MSAEEKNNAVYLHNLETVINQRNMFNRNLGSILQQIEDEDLADFGDDVDSRIKQLEIDTEECNRYVREKREHLEEKRRKIYEEIKMIDA